MIYCTYGDKSLGANWRTETEIAGGGMKVERKEHQRSNGALERNTVKRYGQVQPWHELSVFAKGWWGYAECVCCLSDGEFYPLTARSVVFYSSYSSVVCPQRQGFVSYIHLSFIIYAFWHWRLLLLTFIKDLIENRNFTTHTHTQIK